MSAKLERLEVLLGEVFGARALSIKKDRGELTLEVAAADYHAVAVELRDRPELAF